MNMEMQLPMYLVAIWFFVFCFLTLFFVSFSVFSVLFLYRLLLVDDIYEEIHEIILIFIFSADTIGGRVTSLPICEG